MVDLHEPDAPAAEPVPLPESPDGAAETLTADSPDPADGGPSDPEAAGYSRDDRGRFAPKGQDPAPDPSAPDGGTAPDDPDAPAANPDAPAAAPPAPDAPPGAPTTDQPFTFLHRGQLHGVEGAVVKPDGALVVPAAARGRIEQMLSRGREAEVHGPQREAAFQREVSGLKQQLDTKHAGVDAFSALFADNPDAETFLGRALQFFHALPELRDRLTQDELAARDRRIAELEGRAPTGQAAAGEPTPEVLAQGIDDSIGEALTLARQALPEFREFTDAELLALVPEFRQRAGLVFRRATREDEERHGVPAGSIVRDDDAFAKELRLLAAPTVTQKQRAALQAKQATERAAAAKRNTAVLTAPKLAPVPRPGGGTGGSGAEPQINDMDDFRRWAS